MSFNKKMALKDKTQQKKKTKKNLKITYKTN